ncbi:helix-turn-helix domain-containing protein [uncultured Flavobacterium sp.]|uniref:winged helix-turn-helix transcriptional regulator n=1 Tax=uncultured Flavobacterium sp. TaxID=165435 RepID=UPI0025D1A5C5|nr:helix-turn-helix domain-containing protein [uncultured Flavobacterium sp.]
MEILSAPPLKLKAMSTSECQGRLTAVGDALYVIGGKWKLRIIIALNEGHNRFNELQRVVSGISAKVLSQELKDLEMNGLVERRVTADIPVVVEYLPTPYSHSLRSVLEALSNWGMEHRQKLREEAK